MQLLLKTQTEEAELEDDDPQVSYMISAWARMCKILGKDFTQYLPLGGFPSSASLKQITHETRFGGLKPRWRF